MIPPRPTVFSIVSARCWTCSFAIPSRADKGRSWRPGCVRSGNYIIFYLPDEGIEVVRILSGYLDITPEDME